MHRREFLVGGVSGAALLMTGCATRSVWKSPGYDERISSVLVSEDHKHIVVLGKDYHYVFDAPDELVQTIMSPLHKAVSAYIPEFEVDAENNMSGSLLLTLEPKRSDEQVRLATELGYKRNRAWQLQLYVKLRGRRYASGGVDVMATSQRLNKRHVVRIHTPESWWATVGKIARTPVALASDGLLSIDGVGLTTAILAGAAASVVEDRR